MLLFFMKILLTLMWVDEYAIFQSLVNMPFATIFFLEVCIYIIPPPVVIPGYTPRKIEAEEEVDVKGELC